MEVVSISIPEEKIFDNNVLPLTLVPSRSYSLENDNDKDKDTILKLFIEYLSLNRDHIDNLLRKHKAILFRNFPIIDHHDLHSVIEATGYLGMYSNVKYIKYIVFQ